MLEIHLFVNPLGMRCFECEQDVVRIDQELHTKINYQFVPVLNMNTITKTMAQYYPGQHDLATRTKVAETMYQVILDYKAALFQGRKKGRHYLLQIQTALIKQQQNYSGALAKQIATQVGLDVAMFCEDRKSKLAEKAFEKDQHMADEMGVTQPATAVVYDSNQPVYGFLINDFDYETLIQSYRSHHLVVDQSPEAFARLYNQKAVQSTLRILN